MKPVDNSIELPRVGELFRARSGERYSCYGVMPCDKTAVCVAREECTGWKAKWKIDVSLSQAYCLLLYWRT